MPDWLKIVGVIAIIAMLGFMNSQCEKVEELEKEIETNEAIERQQRKFEAYNRCMDNGYSRKICQESASKY